MSSPEAFWLVAMAVLAGMYVLWFEIRCPRAFKALQRVVEFAFFRKERRERP